MWFPLFRTAVLLGLPTLALLGSSASAQSTAAGRQAPPEDFTVVAKDGVELGATYFPSDEGRDATCIVLLHDYNESRVRYRNLANDLRDPVAANLPGKGQRAVVTIDLRGHGQSKAAYDASGDAYEIDATRFRAFDYEDMVIFDLEAVRAFLVRENDAGRLNLNRLCVVGVGMGANVALAWTELDWRTPDLPMRKQSRDVKAVALVSPRWKYEGLAAVRTLQYPPIQRNLSVMLAYGKDDPKAAEDGRRMFELLGRSRPDAAEDAPGIPQGLYQYALDTKLQGGELAARPGFDLAHRISAFIDANVDQRAIPYFKRK
ncbi:MAG: alpha/beta fold hydrolase [Planctomycetales bacterium]|nr:alpha/beta fold hydrolase [Planctomycetales bacterium]